MALVSLYLRPEVKKDGTSALTIRITKDRKSTYMYLGRTIKPSDWDSDKQKVKKSHPDYKHLNAYLLKRLSEINLVTLDTEIKTNYVSAVGLKAKVKPKGGVTFFSQADAFLDGLKQAGKFNQYMSDKARIKFIKEFVHGGDVAFSDITLGFLDRLKVYLKSERKVGERTVQNYMATIRSVFGYAIANKVIEKGLSPFGKDGLSIKFPDTTKVGISREDVEKLESVTLPNPEHDHARNLWLTSYYFAGMRISDVLRLRWTDFYDARLHYTMGKNKKAGSVKMHDKAQVILAKYEHLKVQDDDFVFPDLKRIKDLKDEFNVQRIINLAVSKYDQILRKSVAPAAGIKSKLSMHIARHTFATLAGDKVNIQMLQKLYRHSDIKTTIAYQANFIHQSADDAIDAVIGM